MSRTHLVIPDQHAHPNHDNSRADLLAKLIIDLRPDVVVNMGDAADMASLSSYDKGKRSFAGRSYKADIDAHLDFQERMWEPVKRTKKKLPYSVVLEGNHERRIEKALDLSPELQGTIGFNDYAFDQYYDDVIRYSGGSPGSINVDGVRYAHYFISGVMGRPCGGEHPAHSLTTKKHQSCTQAHIHTKDLNVATTEDGNKIYGLVAGVYQDYVPDWCGSEAAKLWWSGVVIKHGVENGEYDVQFVSLNRLRKMYE